MKSKQRQSNKKWMKWTKCLQFIKHYRNQLVQLISFHNQSILNSLRTKAAHRIKCPSSRRYKLQNEIPTGESATPQSSNQVDYLPTNYIIPRSRRIHFPSLHPVWWGCPGAFSPHHFTRGSGSCCQVLLWAPGLWRLSPHWLYPHLLHSHHCAAPCIFLPSLFPLLLLVLDIW